MADEKPLRKISDAFKDLAATVNSETSDIEVAPFSRACSLVSPLFGCLGIAFKFAEMDYVSKVLSFFYFFFSPPVRFSGKILELNLTKIGLILGE